MLELLRRLLGRGRRQVVVPAKCPWLVDSKAVAVTEPPVVPVSPPRARWPWLPRVIFGACYVGLAGLLALVVLVVLSLRRPS